MKLRLVWILAVWGLSACATAPPLPPPQALLADDLFPAPVEAIRAEDVFALSAPMREFLDTRLAARVRRDGPRVGLSEALRHDLRLVYDTALTRTAAAAFDARAGNCLSLVILTAAFARELGIPLTYQSIYGYDTWSRGEGLAFLSGHINVVLGTPRQNLVQYGRGEAALTIDFVPPEELGNLRARTIDEATVLAMYFNNRAAEMLLEGRIDQAYTLARAAALTAAFPNSYNTLGVVYRRRGALPQAERAFRAALQHEPENPRALSNLIDTVADQGRTAEAAKLRARLAQIEPTPPYYFLDRGLAALTQGDVRGALATMRKELARMPYDHELHFALALVNLQLGELRQARRHMTLAMEHSTTADRRQLYAAKLNKLKAVGEMPGSRAHPKG